MERCRPCSGFDGMVLPPLRCRRLLPVASRHDLSCCLPGLCTSPFAALCNQLDIDPSPPSPAHQQVLFCGRDMHFGFVFTHQALAGDVGVQVRWALCRPACGCLCLIPLALAARACFRFALNATRNFGRHASKASRCAGLPPHAVPPAATMMPPPSQVVQCDRAQIPAELATADVAVPLMSRLDAPLLRAAPRLKLIIQYGVGVEGVDIPTVRAAAEAKLLGQGPKDGRRRRRQLVAPGGQGCVGVARGAAGMASVRCRSCTVCRTPLAGHGAGHLGDQHPVGRHRQRRQLRRARHLPHAGRAAPAQRHGRQVGPRQANRSEAASWRPGSLVLGRGWPLVFFSCAKCWRAPPGMACAWSPG